MIKDFRVRVTRTPEGFGRYVSKVFAIKEDMFLVYDFGDNYGTNEELPAHFEWVDMNEKISKHPNGYEYRVELIEE